MPLTISSYTISDAQTCLGSTTTLKEHFGQFVQGYSKPQITINFDTSGRNATHVFSMRSGSSSGPILQQKTSQTYTNTSTLTIALDPPPNAETIFLTHTITVTDGTTDTITQSFSVMAYTAPNISVLSVIRHKYITGQGDVAASDGNYIWVSLSATAYATSGANNPATLTFMGSTVTNGNNGLNYSVTNSASLYASSVTTSAGVQFSATISDKVTSTTKYTTAPADGAYFNIERYGVAVGKRTSGYANNKMFEVAQDYRGIFRGDMSVLGDTSLRATDVTTLETSGTATFNGQIYPRAGATFSGSEVHNGSETHYGTETHAGSVTFNGNVTFNGSASMEPTWENVETVSGVNNPNGSSYGGGVLKVSKQGTHVYLRGGVGTTSGHTIGFLDFSYCPSGGDRMFLVATANARVARLRINTSGEIKCDAIYNLSDGSEPTGTLWLDCEVDYWI